MIDTKYEIVYMCVAIIGIYTEDGTYIGGYTYDAWGTIKTNEVTSATTLQRQIVRNYNPFRYHGYYYDTHSSLYYLQSRYYDPATGRFINADGQINPELLGKNLYAYCDNNPIMRIDETGRGWFGALVGGFCSAVIGGIFGALDAAVSGENIGTGFGMGALNGLVVGVVGGCIAEDIATGGLSSIETAQMLISVGVCFAAGVVTDTATQVINEGGFDDIDFGSAIKSGVQNVVITAISLALPFPGTGEVAGNVVVNSVYNLIFSTGQWMYNTIQEKIIKERRR